ncbi:hypothetical protein COOONC_11689 [Cooperia oncophora]
MVKEEKSEARSETEISKQAETLRAATIYFMEWTSTALAHYTSTINELFSKPLIEHCTKTKIAEEKPSADPNKSIRSAEIEKLADGDAKITTRGDHDQLVTRLKEAASRVTEWSTPGENIMNVRNKEVTLAEMAAMYRLRTLISMSANLVELIQRAKTWTKENIHLLQKCRTGNVLPMTLTMFEATCAISEIFQLKSIDRSNAKKEFQQFLRANTENEYKSETDSALVIANPRDYIPHLECRINHYRTCVHLIGSALITTIQTYMNSISLEQMDLRAREVKEVLDRLPPMYTKVRVELKFSDYTSKLIQEYPPNKLQFPFAPKVTDASKKRSGEAVEKEVQGDKTTGSAERTEKQREKIVSSKDKTESTKVAKKDKEGTQPSSSEG